VDVVYMCRTIVSFIILHFLIDIAAAWFLFPTEKLVARCCVGQA